MENKSVLTKNHYERKELARSVSTRGQLILEVGLIQYLGLCSYNCPVTHGISAQQKRTRVGAEDWDGGQKCEEDLVRNNSERGIYGCFGNPK